MYPQDSDTLQTQLVGERHLLELISTGAPLPHVLNKICSALDVQIGNVVSLVLFSDDEEHTMQTFAQSAEHFGLFVFCCTTILSAGDELLGTFEIYCCLPRDPTPSESMLIQRATRLAALAIQRQSLEQDAGRFPLTWKGTMGGSSHEGPHSKN